MPEDLLFLKMRDCERDNQTGSKYYQALQTEARKLNSDSDNPNSDQNSHSDNSSD
jgi:hypothetical protein